MNILMDYSLRTWEKNENCWWECDERL